jgi:hypothetical protein
VVRYAQPEKHYGALTFLARAQRIFTSGIAIFKSTMKTMGATLRPIGYVRAAQAQPFSPLACIALHRYGISVNP